MNFLRKRQASLVLSLTLSNAACVLFNSLIHINILATNDLENNMTHLVIYMLKWKEWL